MRKHVPFKDDKGEPLGFASVKIKGEKGGTTADENGNFRIIALQNATLVYPYARQSRERSTSFKRKISGVSITTTNRGVFENAKINIPGIRSLNKIIDLIQTVYSFFIVESGHPVYSYIVPTVFCSKFSSEVSPLFKRILV